MNVFGQGGGFEALIVRLSPLETLEAPSASAPRAGGAPPPLPPRPAPSAPPPSTALETPTVSPEKKGSIESPLAIRSRPTSAGTGERGPRKPGGVAGYEGVPLEALRYALVAVSSVRTLLARRVSRAIIDRTATAVSAALKRCVRNRDSADGVSARSVRALRSIGCDKTLVFSVIFVFCREGQRRCRVRTYDEVFMGDICRHVPDNICFHISLWLVVGRGNGNVLCQKLAVVGTNGAGPYQYIVCVCVKYAHDAYNCPVRRCLMLLVITW